TGSLCSAAAVYSASTPSLSPPSHPIPMTRLTSLHALLSGLFLLATTIGADTPHAAFAQAQRDDWSIAEPDWARPGPYRWPDYQTFQIESFGARQKLVGTYFFYWFMADAYRQRVRERGIDFYIYHPTDIETMSFLDPAWYEKQFLDMQSAG